MTFFFTMAAALLFHLEKEKKNKNRIVSFRSHTTLKQIYGGVVEKMLYIAQTETQNRKLYIDFYRKHCEKREQRRKRMIKKEQKENI